MKKWMLYLPFPALAYLLYRIDWNSEYVWILSLGILIGINLAALVVFWND